VEDAFVLESLRSCVLFAKADADAVRTVAQGMRRRRYRRNEVIFHQGDPGETLHIVAAGAVKIALPSPEGEEAIIATLRRGDFFGELALLDGAPHSATATALEPTETLTLPRETLRDLMRRDEQLRDALLGGLAAEIRRLTAHVEELHFLDLAGRLAMRLTRLAREADPAATGEVRLDWPYTQSDLAAMIGGTRQSVNKLLAELVDDGLVRLDRDVLVVPDVDKLARRGDR
jgi:CRP/FNR family cyclic AMP-dependent transcriptional regulator